LQLIRGTKYRIDLVNGASIPNRLAYRYSPDEIKELQRQVEELITKVHERKLEFMCNSSVVSIKKEWEFEDVY